MTAPTPTAAQQLNRKEYKDFLTGLWASETCVDAVMLEPLGERTSMQFHAIQIGEVVFFAFY